MKFKEQWNKISKSHDVPIQEMLDHVKLMVHEMDEELDECEESSSSTYKNISTEALKSALRRSDLSKSIKTNIIKELESRGVLKSSSTEPDGVDHPSDDMDKGETTEKPGESIHSAKWDACVRDLKDKKGDAAYAICTAQLGEDSFKSIESMSKSELAQVEKEIKEAMGVSFAGDVPHSLLAEQDLETTSKSEDKEYSINIEYRKKNEASWKTITYKVTARSDDEAKNMACEIFNSEFNMIPNPDRIGSLVPVPYDQSYIIRSEGVNIQKSTTISYKGYTIQTKIISDEKVWLAVNQVFKSEAEAKKAIDKVIETNKSEFDRTGKDLDEAIEVAGEVTSETEKEEVKEDIKNIQIKRQEAEINTRKSFKDVWKTLK